MGFKPYYKWNTFNTRYEGSLGTESLSFKPYYKWNTFNTSIDFFAIKPNSCFKPYYKWNTFNTPAINPPSINGAVLNLIINGIPSIHNCNKSFGMFKFSFKPYYKWNTFNTLRD